ncbi:3-methyl-2-oxobutanoate hydroxymethyltransferase [Candidatus Methylacidiphilum fumarolicum]|uniref:3-methyl-2-oxobutanoate hydroxymethyltransferase n=2 Tax=Candidatus Methylacidiphilum fumarolicum TaxID=591154 RepID=I0JXC5_METFB|nr:3-methyl-2-oxobutanoate hydroxymethyltransferase [Candidatus Methylacidiphilum fumarolicum]MBW6414188.1 3-methyl-2-oxobutanoate hydroxymethyltransferase [Candidatus Methylacidiphilum fumarolicum]TFE69978.1 3-methyl-2-oxobutanoate hydroxymethyltransferase [Candidatus Methylacidiphilum fumarolicum]TFE73782.1 3-methyl-2-oxobutanoate hydroxymethyltransferase [Candidatus Methylacidiphilum fumarolicum]TFE75611.1 3-methyl-2-oxobutanoate hydroxymethyltransferase [Candidatus Methylacidiphilum fumarol
MNSTKITPDWIRHRKNSGEKIAALTVVDYPTAKIVDEAGLPLLLVGDSLGMVVLGYENTTKVSLDDMLHHVRAVARAKVKALVVADMPYGWNRNPNQALYCAQKLCDAGAEAVKVEGGTEIAATVELLLAKGIQVMGHIGLMPQFLGETPRYRKQGLREEEKKKIIDDALFLSKAGVFSIVLEAVEDQLAEEITKRVEVPTIGIGSGKFCDGQIRVFHDLMGLFPWFRPKFVQPKLNLALLIKEAATAYKKEVQEAT